MHAALLTCASCHALAHTPPVSTGGYEGPGAESAEGKGETKGAGQKAGMEKEKATGPTYTSGRAEPEPIRVATGKCVLGVTMLGSVL